MFLMIRKSCLNGCILILLGLLSVELRGQTNLKQVSSFLLTPDTNTFTKPSPFISWDTRLSVINNDWITFKGVKVGVKIGQKRHKISVAYRWLTFEKGIDLLDFSVPIYRIINKSYFTIHDSYFYTLSYDHFWVQKKRFALATPIEFGWGAAFDKGRPTKESLKVWKQNDAFAPIMIGLYAEHKTSRYVGINSRIGYRFVANEITELPSIAGLYFDLGVKLYAGTMYRDTKWFAKTHFSNNRAIE